MFLFFIFFLKKNDNSAFAGVGKPLSPERCRMLLALRINVLAKGYSGISLETLKQVIEVFNGKAVKSLVWPFRELGYTPQGRLGCLDAEIEKEIKMSMKPVWQEEPVGNQVARIGSSNCSHKGQAIL